ncbi:hypothetical protein [Yersinia enterocolitica]|uniref:hypothetical protein n=1 Tax=Yersinia enterocolitica TaxID=630 RepID=UPI003D044D9E
MNEKQISFEEASKPLIKWLAENVHPHHTVIVTSTGAELIRETFITQYSDEK